MMDKTIKTLKTQIKLQGKWFYEPSTYICISGVYIKYNQVKPFRFSHIVDKCSSHKY